MFLTKIFDFGKSSFSKGGGCRQAVGGFNFYQNKKSQENKE